jgi:hypothetical protein
MTFPMAKKNTPQLTFIAQAEIQVQEASPKEKKRKKNVNDVPNGKNTLLPAYLHSPSRNPSPGSVPYRKKRKRNVNDVPNIKKKMNLNLPFIVQAEIQVQEGVS